MQGSGWGRSNKRIQRPSADFPLYPLIPKIAEKKKILRAFQGTGFEMGSRKGLLPGMNRVICTDSHNYKYEIIFDRGTMSGNSFNFDFRVMGCDFIIAPFISNFYVKSEEEAEQIITKLAGLLDTPDWYWENRSRPDW